MDSGSKSACTQNIDPLVLLWISHLLAHLVAEEVILQEDTILRVKGRIEAVSKAYPQLGILVD
jgi:hypothetical protein